MQILSQLKCINNSYSTILIGFLTLFAWLSAGFNVAHASTVYLDNFDNYDQNWELYSGSFQETFYDGSAHTYGVALRNANFLELELDQNILQNPIEIEIGFYHVFTGTQGAGLGVNDTEIGGMIDHMPLRDELIFNIWPQGVNNVGSTVSICMEEDIGCQNEYVNVFQIPNSQAQTLQKYNIKYDDGIYEFYLNGFFLGRSIYTDRQPKYIWIGNPENTTQDQMFSQMSFDYIKITDGEEEETLPGFYYSQTDPRWGDQEYDRATEWAGEAGTDIGRWGCALTSAAMVLKKNEVKAPDGSELTPLKLNEWLKAEPDGYIGSGHLNWISVTRLVRTSKLAGQSPTTLEFVREPGTAEIIDTRLAESLMPILNLSGHFAVVHSETDPLNWGLADPLDETNTALSKTTAVSSNNLFIPSDTDLAYIMMVAHPATTLALLDASGAPQGATYHESLAASGGESAGEINVLYYPKPQSGKYYFEAMSDTTIYLYDGSGNVEISQLPPGHYTIDYDHEKVSKSKVKKESFRELVWRLFRAKQIKKYATAYKIATRYNIAQELNRPFTQKTYKRIIKSLGEYIARQNDKQISKAAKDLLLQYLQDD